MVQYRLATLDPRKNENYVRAVSDNHVLMYRRINLAAIAQHPNVCSVIVLVCSTFSGAKIYLASALLYSLLCSNAVYPFQPNYPSTRYDHVCFVARICSYSLIFFYRIHYWEKLMKLCDDCLLLYEFRFFQKIIQHTRWNKMVPWHYNFIEFLEILH